MENRHPNISPNSKSKNNNDSAKNKLEYFKDSKLKKILTTQGVSDIISVNRWWEKAEDENEDSTKRWDSLEHNGVLFPPKYQPHNIKILYKGNAINLTPYQEEISSFWAGILENELSTKDICKKNFFKEFKAVMGQEYDSSKFEDFDFSPIHTYLIKQKEIIKNRSTEEKKVIKFCIISGRENKETKDIRYFCFGFNGWG